MRIKYRNSDFIVKEELKRLPEGNHYLYLIHKEDLTTWDVAHQLARHFRVPSRLISFCGLKDRNAIAEQYMSCPQFLTEHYQTNKFNMNLVGKIGHALGANDLLQNQFEIIVRDLNSENITKFKKGIDEVVAFGLANYFDEQRFESRLGVDDFVARRLMLGQYEGALKLMIGQPLKLDGAEEKQFKILTKECWGEWSKLARLAPKKYQPIFRQLQREPRAFEKTFKFFDHNRLEFLVSAFQSYLWNEVAGRFLKKVIKDGFEFSYFLGRFYFYHKIDLKYQGVQIPIMNHQTEISDPMLESICDDVLTSASLGQKLLRLKYPEKIRVKSFLRRLIVFPRFSRVEVIDDEYFRGKKGLVLFFSLGPGSYATLLIKRMMGPKET